MGTVGGGMTAMLAMLKDQFGIDLAQLMQAKTEAATARRKRWFRRTRRAVAGKAARCRDSATVTLLLWKFASWPECSSATRIGDEALARRIAGSAS